MRDYGKLAPTFWTRGSGKRLRGHPVAQVVAAYLSTSPGANMLGIYYVPIDTIAHDTGLTADAVREALVIVESSGYAKYDHDAELAWVLNHAKIEIGPEMKPGDKRRPKLLAELAHVDDHPFADEFVARYADAFGLDVVSKGHRRGIEGASVQQDGASADLGQDRSDPVRAGQDRSGPVSSTAPQLALVVPTELVAEKLTGAVAQSGTSEVEPASRVTQGQVGTDGPASKTRSALRGSRLPPDWEPSPETQAWARGEGVAEPCGRFLAEFRDYWVGVPGARGVKLDWDATYRNRVRQVGQKGPVRGRGRADTRQPLRDPNPEWLTASGGRTL